MVRTYQAANRRRRTETPLRSRGIWSSRSSACWFENTFLFCCWCCSLPCCLLLKMVSCLCAILTLFSAWSREVGCRVQEGWMRLTPLCTYVQGNFQANWFTHAFSTRMSPSQRRSQAISLMVGSHLARRERTVRCSLNHFTEGIIEDIGRQRHQICYLLTPSISKPRGRNCSLHKDPLGLIGSQLDCHLVIVVHYNTPDSGNYSGDLRHEVTDYYLFVVVHGNTPDSCNHSDGLCHQVADDNLVVVV